jgi:hypothetical protein
MGELKFGEVITGAGIMAADYGVNAGLHNYLSTNLAGLGTMAGPLATVIVAAVAFGGFVLILSGVGVHLFGKKR